MERAGGVKTMICLWPGYQDVPFDSGPQTAYRQDHNERFYRKRREILRHDVSSQACGRFSSKGISDQIDERQRASSEYEHIPRVLERALQNVLHGSDDVPHHNHPARGSCVFQGGVLPYLASYVSK